MCTCNTKKRMASINLGAYSELFVQTVANTCSTAVDQGSSYGDESLVILMHQVLITYTNTPVLSHNTHSHT